MSFVTVVMVDTVVPRGTDRGVRILIVDEGGDPFNLENHTVTLLIADSWTGNKSLLKKTGTVVGSSAEGKVNFQFTPEDTEGLMSRSYDMNVFVKNDNTKEEWPAFHGRLGVTPTVPEEVVE